MKTILTIAALLFSFVHAAPSGASPRAASRDPASKHRSKKRRRKAPKIIRNDFSSNAKPKRGLASTEDQPKKAPPAEDQSTYEPEAYQGRSTEK